MWWKRHILFSAIYAYTVTHWGLVTPYGDKDLGNIGSGNCFLPGHSKPLTESMLTHHQWRPLPFRCRQFHRNFWISPIKECLIIYTKTWLHITGAKEVIVHLILICFQLFIYDSCNASLFCEITSVFRLLSFFSDRWKPVRSSPGMVKQNSVWAIIFSLLSKWWTKIIPTKMLVKTPIFREVCKRHKTLSTYMMYT